MKIAARKPRKLESSRLAFSLNLVLLNQEPGREASERGTDLLLSKDGSSSFHALLGGRRTEDVFSGSSFSYQTLDPEPQTRALTSEGGRRTVDVFSGSSDQELGREASERGTDLLAPEQPLFFF